MIPPMLFIFMIFRARAESWQMNYDGTYHELPYLTDRASKISIDSPFGLGIRGESHTGTADAYHYQGTKLSAAYYVRVEKTDLDFSAGVHVLENRHKDRTRDRIDLFYFNITADWKLSESTKGKFRIGQDLTYHSWIDPSLAASRIAERVAEGTVESSPGRFRLRAQARRALLSDENIRNGYEGHALYELTDAPVKMRLGLGVWEVAFRDRHRNYWTPIEATDVTLRLEFDLWPNDNWYAQAKFYTGLTNDLGRSHGRSAYQELRLNRQFGPVSAGVYYMRFSSITTAYTWWREDLGATLSVPL